MTKKILTFLLTTILVMTNATTAFARKGKTWNEKSEINVISREDGSGTRGAFIELTGVEQKNRKGEKVDMTTEEAIITNNTAVMIMGVNTNLHAIGYISLGSLNDNIKALNIDNVSASVENVKNGTYKFSRPFNIITKGGNKPAVQDFINFIMSSEGQNVIEKNNYISVNQGKTFESNMSCEKIVIAGSSSVSPVIEKLKEEYQKINPNVQIDIQTNDSSTGIKAVTQGICDIGMSSRNLKVSESDSGLSSLTIALDGIAVIVNNANPLTNISIENIKKIYTGEILYWKDLK